MDAIAELVEGIHAMCGADPSAVSDGECFHPYCDIPACDCQVDHVVPYAEGGLTVDDNGRPACGFHNRQRRQGPDPPPP